MTSNIKPTAEYDLIDEKPVVAPNDYFLLHININSLHAHLDELKELLLAIKIMPALIFICETRICNKPSLLNVNIDGYLLMHKPSPTQARSVGIYVRNDIRVKRNDYFNLNLEGCEDLWIDVELNCAKSHYLYGVICRHPNSNVNNFLQELNTKLSLITQKNKKCIIMGDINMNVIEKSTQTVDYLLGWLEITFFLEKFCITAKNVSIGEKTHVLKFESSATTGILRASNPKSRIFAENAHFFKYLKTYFNAIIFVRITI